VKTWSGEGGDQAEFVGCFWGAWEEVEDFGGLGHWEVFSLFVSSWFVHAVDLYAGCAAEADETSAGT
jgi:hypothetical protein